MRTRRQHFAAPGGSHDKLIRFLVKALPIAVGVLAAFMVITPLSPRGEVSFLLDRTKVAVINERLRVNNAMYRGKDDKGEPFSLTAGEAVQKSAAEGIVRMKNLIARILLPDGPARIGAQAGTYNISSEVVSILGPLQVTAADGYDMTANDVSINLRTKQMAGDGGITGTTPTGSFSANTIRADLPARTITLEGNARLSLIPGKMRMPK